MKNILKYCVPVVASLAFYSCGGSGTATHETKVIAHRGYWKTEGSAQNSIASLRKAAEAGCYGSEFDVHLTTDGVPIVNHDNDIDGLVIHQNEYSRFADHKLSNGEVIPTLRAYLEEGARHPELKLIIEIKSASTPEHESRSVEAVMDLVEEMDLGEQVEYIAFSYHVCQRIIARDPSATVAYLNGDKTPGELKEAGFTGLDYNVGIARGNPDLFERARKTGITTNIWTVNDEADMRELVSYGLDYITTDQPELALSIAAER